MTTRTLASATTVLLVLFTSLAPVAGRAQLRPPTLTLGEALVWRPIGPAHAGPIAAIAGHPMRLGVFYAGATGAGLWVTTDFGANWQPLFDAAPAGLVTSIAVAHSAPDVIYVTTSDSSSPDARGALHVSADNGATWRDVTALDGVRPAHVAIDPSDAQRVFVTARSVSPQHPGGLFRSRDGAHTFDRVLDASGDPGHTFVFLDPNRQTHVVATGRSAASAQGQRLVMHSADGGTTWQPAAGIPALADDAELDVTTLADSTTFALVSSRTGATLFRSIAAGTISWTTAGVPLSLPARTPAGPRLSATADGVLLLAAGTLLESRDNGATFTPVARSPEPPATMVWAHPSMPGVRIAAGTDGAVITVNDGATWSPAETLPTAVVDRVSVDASFPYRVCAAMEASVRCTSDSGAARSRALWYPLPRAFDGAVVSDPLDPDVVLGGSGLRYDRRTGQTLNVEPAATGERSVPMTFSADGRTLYAGAGSVWRTTNGGQVWTAMSPALAARPSRISALAVSPIDARIVWAGLDDGRVFVTRDGGSEWLERPSSADAAVSIRSIEPSRFDTNSAYVVLSSATARAGAAPRLVRTRDNGATWVDLGARIGNAGSIHAVREDPLRRGLLFAGTDRSVFVSFDDGETWQSLAVNLPATPVTDLVVKDADLIAGTAGRGVWVLDDLSPLRQMTADVSRAELFLFRPAQAWRVRASDEARTRDDRPAASALLTYALGRDAEEVTLEVIETTTGDVIRRYSNQPGAPFSLAADPHAVPATAGLHRVAWDLRYLPPVPGAAEAAPGTMVLPGTYQVRLTVDGRAVRQAITVRMDPRIRTSMVDLTAQRDLGRALDMARAAVEAARAETSAAGAPASGRASELVELAGDLDQLARVLQQADVRPAARLEIAIEHALQRVSMAIGGDTR